MEIIERTVIEWWNEKKPHRWTLNKYLESPEIMCATFMDKELARAIAVMISVATPKECVEINKICRRKCRRKEQNLKEAKGRRRDARISKMGPMNALHAVQI